MLFHYKNDNFGSMSTQKDSKLKKMLDLHRQGTVALPKWLESLGISRELQKSYRKNGWLETMGPVPSNDLMNRLAGRADCALSSSRQNYPYMQGH